MKRTLIALFTILITVSAFAQPRPGGRRGQGGPDGPPPDGMRGPGRGGPARIAEALDLSDAQKAQVEQFRATLEAAVKPLHDQQRANHEAIKAAVDAGNATAAGNAMIANDKLRDQMKAAHDTFKASLESILTADQKAKLALLEEMHEGRRERRRPGD